MENTIVIAGIVTSIHPITAEQLSNMEELSANLGLASVLTFAQNINRTIDINVRFVCQDETIHTDWFKDFCHKISTVFYLGRKYNLGLTGPIEVADTFYDHLGAELFVENGITTLQHGRMEHDVFQLAGYCRVIDPLPRIELA